MESIKQLREICQSTRPSIYKDFLSSLYYRLSIYFTWICLLFRMTANQVTALSGLVAALGGALVSADSKWVVIIGVLCFHLFAILDMSDGEVARYRKQGGIAGHFLDWYMHFISAPALMFGLFLASYKSLNSVWLVVIAMIGVVLPILDKSILNCGWTVICWTRLRDIKRLGIEDAESELSKLYEEKLKRENEKEIPQRPMLVRRVIFLILAPLQDRWASIGLLLLAIIDLILSFFGIVFLDYRLLWILYVGCIGSIYLLFRLRKMVYTDTLLDGYQRIIRPERPIEFPADDFL